MPKPGGPFLLAAHQRNPITTTAAKALPHIQITLRSARVLRTLEGCASRCAHTVRETLIVPESRVLEHEPTPGLTESTPAFALIAVSAHPLRRIEIAVEAQILFVGPKESR